NGGLKTWNYEDWLDDGHRIHSPVGVFKPNAFGLHDVCGNVWEICLDAFGSYEQTPTDGSAFEWEGASHRVNRGGSWLYSAQECRSANRLGDVPASTGDNLGLRPARTLKK
ncbi:MAG: SUMF1/EgtB/PvdO family nonheme iron enzyme, partial [Planctomycetes bacterium]|nr:SUMF1/EgtB/PvdO family nonheme iron enzyme [Planctomycetota bacterium]